MMTRPWTLPAPAKINLMLHITGQRADGYHELQTLFQLLEFGDQIDFHVTASPLPSVQLIDHFVDLPAADNLISRAAESLIPFAQQPSAVQIQLHKQIPIGGGLGGGSSDAATTLLALNELWQCGLTPEQLAQLGVQLGADVPLFVLGRSAWATGIGEQLTPLTLPTPWFVICHPTIKVSTAEVFADPDLTRNSQDMTIQAALAGVGHNDCEPVVRRNYPEIAAMLDTMNHFGDARLTGTGACGFIAVAEPDRATQIVQSLTPLYPTILTRGINTSPVHQRIAEYRSNPVNSEYP